MRIDFEASEASYIRNRREAMGLWRKFCPIIKDLEAVPRMSRKLKTLLETRFTSTELVNPRVIQGKWLTTKPEYQKTKFIVVENSHSFIDACFYPISDIDAVAFYGVENLHYSWFVHELQHRKRWLSNPEMFHVKKIDLSSDIEIEAYYNQFCSIVDRNKNINLFRSNKWSSEFPYLKKNRDAEVTIRARDKFVALCEKYTRRYL